VRLSVCPIEFDEACAFVRQHHRHHGEPQGYKFCIGLMDIEKIVGVAIVGRPVARVLQDGWTLEVTRLTTDGTPNACSMLYAACWRAAKAMGYRKLITYILDSEAGTSLTAAGWKCIAHTRGKTWYTPSRPRVDKHPTQGKLRFEVTT